MNDIVKTMIIVIGFSLFFVAAIIVEQKMTDDYCLNTPMDRINKQRCGIGQ